MSNDNIMVSLRRTALVTGITAAVLSGLGATFTTAAFYRYTLDNHDGRITELERSQKVDREMLIRIDENVKSMLRETRK